MSALGELVEEVLPGFASGAEDPTGLFQFRMNNISSASQLVLDKRRRVPPDAHKRIPYFLVRSGDVLFNATNSPDGVGKSVLIPELDEPAVFSNHFLRIRTKSDKLEPAYLWRWLQWQHGRGVFSAMCHKWVNQATVSRERLLSLDVRLPPLAEQRRIAAILDESDALRTKRRRALTLLDSLAPSLFVETFGYPSSQSSSRTIGELATVVTGNTPPRTDERNFGDAIEWVKSDNLGQSVATRADEWLSDHGAARGRIAPSGSVLVTCIAGSPRSIGKCSRVDRPVAFNQQINAVLPSAELDSVFLLNQLKVAPGLVRGKSTGGMKGLVSKSAFRSIEIIAPPITRQRDYSRRVKAIDGQRSRVERALAADDELFASVQHRAFRGEL